MNLVSRTEWPLYHSVHAVDPVSGTYNQQNNNTVTIIGF